MIWNLLILKVSITAASWSTLARRIRLFLRDRVWWNNKPTRTLICWIEAIKDPVYVRTAVLFSWMKPSPAVHIIDTRPSTSISVSSAGFLWRILLDDECCCRWSLSRQIRSRLRTSNLHWSSLRRFGEHSKDATATNFCIWFVFYSFLEDVNCDIGVAHGTLLGLLLLRSAKPFHDAVVMEDMATARDLSNLGVLLELFHANDTLSCIELVDLFHILPILNHRNELGVLVN